MGELDLEIELMARAGADSFAADMRSSNIARRFSP